MCADSRLITICKVPVYCVLPFSGKWCLAVLSIQRAIYECGPQFLVSDFEQNFPEAILQRAQFHCWAKHEGGRGIEVVSMRGLTPHVCEVSHRQTAQHLTHLRAPWRPIQLGTHSRHREGPQLWGLKPDHASASSGLLPHVRCSVGYFPPHRAKASAMALCVHAACLCQLRLLQCSPPGQLSDFTYSALTLSPLRAAWLEN